MPEKKRVYMQIRMLITCGFLLLISFVLNACTLFSTEKVKTNVQVPEYPPLGNITDVDLELNYVIVQFAYPIIPPKTLLVKNNSYDNVAQLTLTKDIEKKTQFVAYDIAQGNPEKSFRVTKEKKHEESNSDLPE